MNQEVNRQSSVRKIRDRYKPLFCSREFYENNQNNFAILATNIVAGGKTEPKNKPDQFEKFIVTTLLLSLLRRPYNWFGGIRKSTLLTVPNLSSAKHYLESAKMKHFTDSVGVKWTGGINPEISVYEFLNSVKIKSVPEKIFWSLNFLLLNKNLFVISKVAPTPYELLKIQARGQRIITYEENFSLWAQLNYEHRDVLSFWFHDLIHAAEFFQNEEQKKHQVNFYRWIEELSSNSSREVWLRHFLSVDRHRSKFEYLISDMNSHPLHLIKTFRAILDEHDPQNWQNVIETTSNLLAKGYLQNSRNAPTLDVLHRVNSIDFESFHYDALLHILSCINQIWLLSNKPSH